MKDYKQTVFIKINTLIVKETKLPVIHTIVVPQMKGTVPSAILAHLDAKTSTVGKYTLPTLEKWRLQIKISERASGREPIFK